FRICHISIQQGHLHLVCEADDRMALARGLQGFQISCARRLNRALTRRNGFDCRGPVFADRYHARILHSPRQVHHALRYVLSNWRRHRQDTNLPWAVDLYSSAARFDGWAVPPPAPRPDALGPPPELPTALPETWLLTTGWRR